MIWHSSTAEAVKTELSTDETAGLSAADVAGRIQKFGENRIILKEKRSFALSFLKNFVKPVNIVLWITAAVLFVTRIIGKNNNLWYSISVILLTALSALLCTVQQRRAEHRLAGGKGKIALSAKVIREGSTAVVDSAMLVPGDIVVLEAGDYIPADGRLLQTNSLICDESAITGDPAPNEKRADAVLDDICALDQRKNMVYSGCSVTYGSAVMAVTETGMHTEIGKQASLEKQMSGTSLSFKNSLAGVGSSVAVVSLVLSVVLFITGMVTSWRSGQSFSDLVFSTLITSLSLISVSFSDILPLLAVSSLSFGEEHLLKSKVITHNIPALEQLGNITYLLSDKTGTLTLNKMKMTLLFDGSELFDLDTDELSQNALTLISTGALCCNGRVTLGASGKERCIGDPTEAGIVSACLNYCNLSKDEIENIYPRMTDVPFDSQRKLMTTVNIINNLPFAIVKGAPDIVFECCTSGNIKGAKQAAAQMAETGQRVIAVAVRQLSEVPANPTAQDLECDLSILGLFGMTDTVDKATFDSLRECKKAGITVAMLTGDHISTAKAIAKQIGILKDGMEAITGEEIRAMSDSELESRVRKIAVYSRISAEDRLRVVSALQKLGEKVAVTGDSVSDAQVLKAADAGFAMGVTGTDIAKGSADFVLSDDRFSSAVCALKEGRGIFSGLQRSVLFIVSNILGIMLTMILGGFIFKAMPMQATHILWLLGISGIFSAFAVGAEYAGSAEMDSPSRQNKSKVFTTKTAVCTLWQGGLMVLFTLLGYLISMPLGAGFAQSTAFAAFSMLQIASALSCRCNNTGFAQKFAISRNLLINLGIMLATAVALILTPLGGIILLSGVSAQSFGVTIGFSLLYFAICEGINIISQLKSKKV